MLDAGQAQIGGLAMSATTVDIEIAASVATLEVSGSITLDEVDLTVTGTVTPADAAVGRITLTGGTDTLVITDGLTVESAELSATVASLPGPGTPAIAVTGNATVLDTTVVVSLAGSSTGTEITELSGTAPSTEFPLAEGDTLTSDLLLTYDSGATPPLQITSSSGSATLTTPTRTFGAGTMALQGDAIELDASIDLPGSLGLPVAVDGEYTLVDGAGGDTSLRGDYELVNPSATTLTLAGFEASGQATFARTGDEDEAASLTATFSLGLFDTDTPIVLEGPIDDDGTATLTGAQEDVELRGLSGNATLTVEPGDGSLGAGGWYDAAIDFQTRPGDCAMWSGAPDLTGEVYRSGDTTSYTLTGTTHINLPSGIDLMTPGQATQPLVLSNEALESPAQPADGITFALGMKSETFTATGSMAFAVAQCSYSVNGFLSLTFGGSALGSSLGNSFSPVGSAQEQLGDLFGPNGALPSNARTVREAREAAALSAAHTKATAAAQTRLNWAKSGLSNAKDDLDDAAAQLAGVRQQLDEAQRQYEVAIAKLAADPAPDDAPGDAPGDAPSDAPGSSGWPSRDPSDPDDDPDTGSLQQQVRVAAAAAGDAGAAHSSAERDLERAEVAVDRAQAEAGAAQAVTDDAVESADAALLEATDAAQALSDAKAAEEEESDEKTLEVTFGFTHCTTCDPVDTFTISGELTFEVIYTAGLDLTLGWNDDGMKSIDGTVSFGIEKEFTAGWSHFNIYASAEAKVSLELGYDVDDGWVKAEADLEMKGKLQVNVHLWIISFHATLASVSIDARMSFLPPPVTVAGSASIHVLGFGGSVHFGPVKL